MMDRELFEHNRLIPEIGFFIDKRFENKYDAFLAIVTSPVTNDKGFEKPNQLFGKSVADLFPMKFELRCGCSFSCTEMTAFPNESFKCEHGNYLVKYEGK